MVQNYYEIVKKRIWAQMDSKDYQKTYKRKEQGKVDRHHFLEIVNFVQELWEQQEQCPLPIALKIAALCHDTDRIYPEREVNTKDCPPELYMYRKGIHAGTTALLFFEHHQDLPKTLIDDVCYLILRHEKGGDRSKTYMLLEHKDAFTKTYNLNKAADCLWWSDKLSFFSSNIVEYAKRGEEELKKKILFSIEGLPPFAIKKILTLKYPPKIKNLLHTLLSDR